MLPVTQFFLQIFETPKTFIVLEKMQERINLLTTQYFKKIKT